MKYNQNLSKFFKIFLGTLVIVSNLAVPTTRVFAATPTCKTLVDPKTIEGYIFTITEERINAPTPGKNPTQMVDGTGEGLTDQDQGVLNCFRKTTCNLTSQGVDGNGKPLEPTKKCEDSTYVKTCEPSNTIICQPIQVIFARSGASLLYTYVGLIYRWAAGTVGIVTVLYIVIGGIQMASAQGDPGKYEKAKERITNSIAGLVLLFLSALILYTINPNFFTIG